MHFVCFSMPFVKCIFLWVPFWYPLANLFSNSLMNTFDLHVKKLIFLQKINQKWIWSLCISFFWVGGRGLGGGLHSRNKMSGNKRIPSLEILSRVLVVCFLGSLQSYQENYKCSGWCCVTGRNNTGGRRDVTSAHVSRVILFVTLAVHLVTAELQLVMREHLSLWGVKLLSCIKSSVIYLNLHSIT